MIHGTALFDMNHSSQSIDRLDPSPPILRFLSFFLASSFLLFFCLIFLAFHGRPDNCMDFPLQRRLPSPPLDGAAFDGKQPSASTKTEPSQP